MLHTRTCLGHGWVPGPWYTLPMRASHGLNRRVSRSAAETMVQAVQAPVQEQRASRNLVVAIDQSEGSYKAVRWTLQNLYRDGDVLHLLHVVPTTSGMSASAFGMGLSMPAPEEGLQEKMAEHARQFIEKIYLKLAIEYGAQCEIDLVAGQCNKTVSTLIVDKCEDLAASVVVLSMQKQGFIDSLFQVPVTKQVADRCSRPTLIYHCDNSTCAPAM